MRKAIFTLGLSLIAVASGCYLPENKSRCGFHFEILKPPVIETSTPVLVNMGPGMQGAHPLGTLAGPVQRGEEVFGPARPPVPVDASMFLNHNNLKGVSNDCLPTRGGLSVEEWCRLMAEMNARRMPVGSASNAEQK